MSNQLIKADGGKPRLSLCPLYIMTAIARVREFGITKYPSIDSWKEVELQRYIDALLRHTIAFVEDPTGVDEESGLPHLWHLDCNAAFITELMKGSEWNELQESEKVLRRYVLRHRPETNNTEE